LEHDQCALEEKEIGVNHAEAGAHFLRRWKLAEDLTEAIRCHHRPAEAPPACRDRAFLLFFASLIARMHQTEDQAVLLVQIVRMGGEPYPLYDQHLFAFMDSLQDKIGEFAALLEVDLGP